VDTSYAAIEILKSEHRRIEAVLDALCIYRDWIAKGDSVATDDLGRFVHFFQDYADRKHHAKEEDILFATMLEAGFPREVGPIPVMLSEHQEGRALVGILSECAVPQDWSQDTRSRARVAISEFSSLLRSHIQKEDNVLYEMARTRLSPEQAQHVDDACAERDLEHGATGATAELVALADALIARYNAESPAVLPVVSS